MWVCALKVFDDSWLEWSVDALGETFTEIDRD
jgi:hypothetical protein